MDINTSNVPGFFRRNLTWIIVAVVVIIIGLLALSGSHHANAQTGTQNSPFNLRTHAAANATANQTFATTSYADLAGATLTFTPVRDPAQTDASLPGGPRAVIERVQVSLDVTKATTLTGTCAIYANGAVIAQTARTVDVAAKESTMDLLADVTLTTAGSNIIKVQCKSADTAVLTVANGTMAVTERY